MSETLKLVKRAQTHPLRVVAEDGRVLIQLNPDGTVTGTVEEASEAGRVFVESIRWQWSPLI